MKIMQTTIFEQSAPAPAEPTTARVSEAVLALLRAAVIEGHVLLPMPQAPRAVYEELADILGRLRGKWKRGKGHVFPYDPTAAIAAVVVSGCKPSNNPLAYFPTPAEVAGGMIADIDATANRMGSPLTMLEPSAGSGALILAALERWPIERVVAIEADPLNTAMLRGREWPTPDWFVEMVADGFVAPVEQTVEIIDGDFLARDFGDKFDLILMNPPFSLLGDPEAYRTHLRRAFDLLAPRGRLACVVPDGPWRTSEIKRHVEWRAWLDSLGATILEHPAGSFRASGTSVKTATIILQRFDEDHLTAEHNGYPSQPAFICWLYMDNDREWQDRGRALAHLAADHPDVRAFLRSLASFANSAHGGGVPVCERLLDQLASGWPGEVQA